MVAYNQSTKFWKHFLTILFREWLSYLIIDVITVLFNRKSWWVCLSHDSAYTWIIWTLPIIELSHENIELLGEQEFDKMSWKLYVFIT